MSDPLHHMYVLHTNPFLFATTVHAFYERLGTKEKSILLAYLILPIVLDKRNRLFLARAKSTSSLRTMLADPKKMRALPARVEQFREVTNGTLRYLFSLNALCMKEDSVVLGDIDEPLSDVAPENAVAAARKLADWLQPLDIPTIYRTLGVLQL